MSASDPHATRPTVDAELENSGVDTLSADGESSERNGDARAMPRARQVAHFVLLDQLGAGGMGVVYRAYDTKLDRQVAIKLVQTRGSLQRAQHRLLREAQAQARLSHPNVVTVYEVGTLSEGELFIAMELVKGPTLRNWQRTGTRGWREIADTYAGAGAGLAAAHRNGIVHRDFKPDNVLIGEDGRARVADFGLAFAAEAGALASQPIAVPRDDEPADATQLAAASVSELGAPAGTPGYMAPEQLVGQAIDARTDQFAFCVALYEALHGHRPAPLTGKGERPSPPSPYPSWLWLVMTRGLAHEPSQRFASMDALLAELTRKRERSRMRWVAAAIASAAVAAGATAALIPSADVCPRATAELAGIWDDPTKQHVQTGLLGTKTPFAEQVWTSMSAALDHHAERWLDAQQETCRATNVQHKQSSELLDRRMECLAQRKRELAAAAEVLVSQPAQALAHTTALLETLGDIARCADAHALLELSQAGVADAVDPKVIAVRQQLARATALFASRAIDPSIIELAAANKLAESLDRDTLRAEAGFLDGRIKQARGNVAGSSAALDRALALAVSSHDDELAIDIYLHLATVTGSRQVRPEDIQTWLGQAEAWFHRLGHAASDAREIGIERARGNLELLQDNPKAALATLSSALNRAEALWGKTDPRLAGLLRNRSAVYARMRNAQAAVADGERALTLAIAAWGPEHPEILSARRVLGMVYVEELGDVDRGEREIMLAREASARQLGADSAEVANCEALLARVGKFRGDYDAAIKHAALAEQIYGKVGNNSPPHVEALNNLAILRFMRKDFAGALADYQRTYPILESLYGPKHGDVGLLLSNIGEALLALNRIDEAKANFEKAQKILEPALGTDHAYVALPLKGLGLVALRQHRPQGAVRLFERALELWTKAKAASDPEELASVEWGLAQSLRLVGKEPNRARQLAQSALEAYRKLGAQSADRVNEISAWLSK